ncbi:MAG TPA: superoxide dismutase family protein [Clostridia bacterium]|nr:superoxide dismutase family protein [Clostridia bacterium]
MNLKPGMPAAAAVLRGSVLAPRISGTVEFYPVESGTVVRVDVCGLPVYMPAAEGRQPVGPFGFHIHEGNSCTPADGMNPFSSSGGHYNPARQPHGNHAGDLPVLFSNHGCAHMCVFTDQFRVEEVIGRTVIIHQNPDDFRTQPAGNSGLKIACGVISRI